jgi:hypothetical protein
MSARLGRPSTFTEEMAKDICAFLAQGETLAQVLRRPGMPQRATVYDWEQARPEFKAQIREARIGGAWALADQILDIGDEPVKNNPDASRQRERVRIRMWLLSKILPAEFADKISMDVTQRVDFHDLSRKHSEANGRLEYHRRERFLSEVAAKLEGPARSQFLERFPLIGRTIEGTATRLPDLSAQDDSAENVFS